MRNNLETKEHLSKIYFSKLYRGNKPEKEKRKWFFVLGLGVVSLFIISLTALLVTQVKPPQLKQQKTALFLSDSVLKINYDFSKGPLRKEKLSMDLKYLDLRKFKALEFSLRKLNQPAESPLTIHIVMENYLREKSDYFITLTKSNWEKFRLNFSEFKGIHFWSNLKELSFLIEEYNSQSKSGTVLIDDLCFVK